MSSIVSKLRCVFLIILLVPDFLEAEIKTWTGNGFDMSWTNSLNWSDKLLPQPGDDVLLDNGNIPTSYQIVLPGYAVTIKTLHIKPSRGRNIEVILPVSNVMSNALTVTGPGYGIELDDGAVFRNASGISSGESLQIADSIIIHDGGRYIHQTRASHANSILKFLSTAPGTEHGVFDFNVPRASYTISVSNRTYGCLELHKSAYGLPVNYTCSGSNPLLITGDLRIGDGVNVTMNLNGTNGNIQVAGDFIQEGGILNLASVRTNNTILKIKGNIYQAALGVITETTGGSPFLELNGNQSQEVNLAGQLTNHIGFRLNNGTGAVIHMPLLLPYQLDLRQGSLTSTALAPLILSEQSFITVDSSANGHAFVNGPMCKLGLSDTDYFLFPTGKGNKLRWLELKSATGDFTVEYFNESPMGLSSNIGSGLDHISKMEYWKIIKTGPETSNEKIELSYSAGASGIVSDPDYLNISQLTSNIWTDVGHSVTTGNSISGSVVSGPLSLTSGYYSLASTLDSENPLPLTQIILSVSRHMDAVIFNWNIETTEQIDSFQLYEVKREKSCLITEIKAMENVSHYEWTPSVRIDGGKHFYMLRMVDKHGMSYISNTVMYTEKSEKSLSYLSGFAGTPGRILLKTNQHGIWSYRVLTITGKIITQGKKLIQSENNYLYPEIESATRGLYIFQAIDPLGNNSNLIFSNN